MIPGLIFFIASSLLMIVYFECVLVVFRRNPLTLNHIKESNINFEDFILLNLAAIAIIILGNVILENIIGCISRDFGLTYVISFFVLFIIIFLVILMSFLLYIGKRFLYNYMQR